MTGLLWLLGAAHYAAATPLLTQPFLDGGSASLAAEHETVVAKQVPSLAFPDAPTAEVRSENMRTRRCNAPPQPSSE